jgi:DNA-binding MarR family transcriptional regulator
VSTKVQLKKTAPPTLAGDAEVVDLDVLPQLLTFNLRRIQSRLRRTIADRVQRTEQGAGVFSVLILAGANPGLGQNRLARHCELDEVSIVALLDRLEDSGWVKRQRSQLDRRRQGIFLTAAGEKKVRELKKIALAREDAFLVNLTPAERQQLLGLLQRLLD